MVTPETPNEAHGGLLSAAQAAQSSITWRSCCLTADRRAVVYFSQLTVCLSIMGFCVGRMTYSDSCETYSRWSPLLTFLIGVLIPSPKIRSE